MAEIVRKSLICWNQTAKGDLARNLQTGSTVVYVVPPAGAKQVLHNIQDFFLESSEYWTLEALQHIFSEAPLPLFLVEKVIEMAAKSDKDKTKSEESKYTWKRKGHCYM